MAGCQTTTKFRPPVLSPRGDCRRRRIGLFQSHRVPAILVIVKWLLIGLGTAAVFLMVESLYFGTLLRRESERTLGLGYYGLSAGGRAATEAELMRHHLAFDFRSLSTVTAEGVG